MRTSENRPCIERLEGGIGSAARASAVAWKQVRIKPPDALIALDRMAGWCAPGAAGQAAEPSRAREDGELAGSQSPNIAFCARGPRRDHASAAKA